MSTGYTGSYANLGPVYQPISATQMNSEYSNLEQHLLQQNLRNQDLHHQERYIPIMYASEQDLLPEHPQLKSVPDEFATVRYNANSIKVKKEGQKIEFRVEL